MYRYTAIAQLREIVMTMERDLGLIALSHNEKDVLYAVQSVLAVSDGVAKSDEIRSHDLVRDMSQPTFHRALKSLLARVFSDMHRTPRQARTLFKSSRSVSD